MNYTHIPNYLLESLAYLGRKASNNTWDTIDNKIKKRNIENSRSFQETFSKLKSITIHIDDTISISDDKLHSLFGNIEGFPFNTVGTSSVAFIIFFSVLEEFNGDFDVLIKKMKKFSKERIAYNISAALDISDNCNVKGVMSDREFMDGVLSLSIPAESKIAILDTYRNYYQYLDDISGYLRTVIDILVNNKDILSDITSSFNMEINSEGCEKTLNQISQFKPLTGVNYYLQPFIFGMDTVLVSNLNDDSAHIYCGILRKELLDMLNKQVSFVDELYEAYNLLGDRTRFDILCYLRKNSAYGQELSNHFNLSRNTIHHHMSKLINYGFVVCTTDGNRVYYSLDNETFETLLFRQKELFCSKS